MRLTHVTLRVKPDKAAVYEAAFAELRKHVLANEPGVFVFEACRDPDVPNGYRVLEGYRNQDAIDVHIAKDYYKKSARIFVECLEGDHMEEINQRGLIGVEMYRAVKTIKLDRLETLSQD